MSTKKKNVGRKPIRSCVCCQSENQKSDMIRIVVSGRNTEVDNSFKDDTGKVKGRGAYICKKETCINKAFADGLIDEATKELCLADAEKYKLSLLPIAMKSGRIAAGEFQCEESIKSELAYFAIIAEDASDNTRKKFVDKCEYRSIPYVIYGKKEELGRLIGKAERSVLVIKDQEFGDLFKTRFGGNE